MSEDSKQSVQVGHTFIPATRRKDGTWRKAIKVKEGYVPPDEQPKYKINKVYTSEKSEFPVGLSSEDIEKAKTLKMIREAKEHGLDLNFTVMSKSAKKKARRKQIKKDAEAKLVAEMDNLHVNITVDSECEKKKKEITEKLKSLRKDLKDTEILELQMNSDETVLERDKDNMLKNKKLKILQELKDLEVILRQLNDK